jgi:hypothetical protein
MRLIHLSYDFIVIHVRSKSARVSVNVCLRVCQCVFSQCLYILCVYVCVQQLTECPDASSSDVMKR